MASHVKIPAGEKITISHGKLQVPDRPIIAFIEGDGTGPDIWAASVRVLDAAVEQAYRGKKKLAWAEAYAGIEWEQGTPEAKKVIEFLQKEMKVTQIRFPQSSSIGIKPVSKEGSERLIRAAMRYAIENGRRNVTLVHKGNIQKYTEGMFM